MYKNYTQNSHLLYLVVLSEIPKIVLVGHSLFRIISLGVYSMSSHLSCTCSAHGPGQRPVMFGFLTETD